jgi:hypothetical protein
MFRGAPSVTCNTCAKGRRCSVAPQPIVASCGCATTTATFVAISAQSALRRLRKVFAGSVWSYLLPLRTRPLLCGHDPLRQQSASSRIVARYEAVIATNDIDLKNTLSSSNCIKSQVHGRRKVEITGKSEEQASCIFTETPVICTRAAELSYSVRRPSTSPASARHRSSAVPARA